MARIRAARDRAAKIGFTRNGTVNYDPRELWAVNVAPLVTAARAGATHAARTARQERARANRHSPWWQRRWVAVTASGLVIAGAAGGAYAVVAKRRSQAKPAIDEMASQPDRTGSSGIRSTMEAGRDKVADATRTVMHKIRRNGDAATMEQPTVAEHPRRNEMPATGTGYGPMS